MYGDQFGGLSFTAIYKREQDKMANQFVVDTAQTKPILPGEPVMLMPKGTIKSYVNDRTGRYIGINLLDGAVAGGVTTVSILISHVMLYAKSAGDFEAGDEVTVTREDEVPVPATSPETALGHYAHLVATKLAVSGEAVAIAMEPCKNNTPEMRILVLDAPISVTVD
jgi:hypothetical protein|uniref:Uncharacterized protein n=1 Tax=Ackermannviridae sp. ctClB2 TaxID=2825752 RepID=A0A8S5P159_9CAUD|nr:MAG TPA: hypothetical protein [Ackermannviridae sp. ctClB2]